MRSFVALAVLAAPLTVNAQVRLELTFNGEDQVGQRLNYQLKEAVGRSAIFSSPIKGQGRMRLSVVSMDPDETRGTQNRTIYAATIVFAENELAVFPMFLTSYVGTCGTSKVAECAEDLLASVSSKVDELDAFVKQGRSKVPSP